MKSEFISTHQAKGWIHFNDEEFFNQTVFNEAKNLGFIDPEAHIIARMSKSQKLPRFTNSKALWNIAFKPLRRKNLELYAIVNSSQWLERVLRAGVGSVQLRIKDLQDEALRKEIQKSIALAQQFGAQLFINDHWKIALEEGAYGIHLGQEDLDFIAKSSLQTISDKGLRLGISTHAYWEVCKAVALNPSYIACGPIHPTAVKAMPWIAQGNDNLAYWCSQLNPLDIPVVAIAGMNPQRATQAVQCGASGVAVISAITAASNPKQAIEQLQAAIASGKTLPAWPVPLLANPSLQRPGD